MNWHTNIMIDMESKSMDELRYIKQDCLEAARAGETISNPKVGQYWDAFHYAAGEIKRRKDGGRK